MMRKEIVGLAWMLTFLVADEGELWGEAIVGS